MRPGAPTAAMLTDSGTRNVNLERPTVGSSPHEALRGGGFSEHRHALGERGVHWLTEAVVGSQPAEQAATVMRGGWSAILGSSGNSGKRGADFQEEVVVVAIPVRHPLHHFDLVVDPLEQTGVKGIARMVEDVLRGEREPLRKAHEERDATPTAPGVPVGPGAACGGATTIAPELPEVFFQDIDDKQRAIGREEFLEPHALAGPAEIGPRAEEQPSHAFPREMPTEPFDL